MLPAMIPVALMFIDDKPAMVRLVTCFWSVATNGRLI